MPLSPVIMLHPDDDVAIARVPLAGGDTLPGLGIRAANPIPFGHKIAVRDLPAGAPVKRYNQIIGFAGRPVTAGEHVHLHNLVMGDFQRDYAFCRDVRPTPQAPGRDTFRGIVRQDGRVATRNYIGVLSTVNCSATLVQLVADHFRLRGKLEQYPNVDGVVAFPHPFGCGLDAKGESMLALRRVLGGYARHVNFAGVVIAGLGCETNLISTLMEAQGLQESARLRTLAIQDAGGTGKALAQAVAAIEDMLPEADRVERVDAPASEIVLALECGGSDSYSGITANPVLGAATDLLVAQGGTAILSETPEIYGAEHLLTRRAVSRAVGEKLVARIRWWEEYTARNQACMNNNPSAGNKEGGLTTILEKSLGAFAKGGSTNLTAVYEYAEPVTEKGLVFMDTPGYDPVAVTGQFAGGANVMCFTTGRGSAIGGKPVPGIKIATNNVLWNRQREDMDFNAGDIIEGTATVEELGGQLYRMVLDTASGRRTRSEHFGYGALEFAPWLIGVVM
jgi:altronate hydrolase